MAVAKTQSNTMLIALVAFVGLFIASTTCAVIYYVKSEEYRTKMETARSEMLKMASTREQGAMGKIVGEVKEGSYLGKMNEHFNSLYGMIMGAPAGEDLSADVKLNDIALRIKNLNESLGDDVSPAVGSEGIALLKTIEDMKAKLDEARTAAASMDEQNKALQDQFDAAKKESQFKEQQMAAQIEQIQKNADDLQMKYDALKKSIDDAANEQIALFKTKLETEQDKLKQKHMELTETQAKLGETEKSLGEAIGKLDVIRPRPDSEAVAYKPDANIIRVDLKNGLVILDIGTDNHVYRGLTFAVYDRSLPIPEDGQGKAELEVFQVDSKVSVARIVKSNIKDPVFQGDIVANLIWDSTSSNRFVVLGAFDYNDDGTVDPDGAKRIEEIITRWGGKIDTDITIDTDFVILGQTPKPMAKTPTQEEIDLDSGLLARYEESVRAVKQFDILLAKAKTLSIPVFSQKRFFYLIGSNALHARMTAP